MSLLTPDTGLLFWMTVSFGIIFLLLARFGFPIITKAIAQRQKYISDSLEAARKAEEQLAAINVQAETIMDNAREQRNVLLNEAETQKKEIIQQARAQAAEETQQKLTQAAEAIDESKRRALGEVQAEIANVSVRIAEKILGEQLHDTDRQQALISRYLIQEVKAE